MNLRTVTVTAFLMTLAIRPCIAGAACFDPKTFISGYKEALDAEIRSAEAIVVGRVMSEVGINQDLADPDGITAHKVTISVLATLKGNVPKSIIIRNENASSRYPMSVGEEHLLFVSRDGKKLWVNSCGNSASMPKARRIVQQIKLKI
jgi:hypothetical protein